MASKFDKEETYNCDSDTAAEDSTESCSSPRSPSPEPTGNLRGGGPQAPQAGFQCGHQSPTYYVQFTCNDYAYLCYYCFNNAFWHCPWHNTCPRKAIYYP